MTGLAACVSVSKPFYDPGKEGKRLVANLPPPRLAVPPPNALFGDRKTSLDFARVMTQALVSQSLPAVTKTTSQGDWWLKVAPEKTQAGVVSRYTIIAPDGNARGHIDGPAINESQWNGLSEATRRQFMMEAAPRIASLLTGIKAEAMMADPNSLKRRAAKIQFLGVQGTPGDGDISLSRAFMTSLPDQYDQITTKKESADFTVDGRVKMTDGPKGTTGKSSQHIEIVWHVRDRAGKEAGAATQLHDVPSGSLDHAWGMLPSLPRRRRLAPCDRSFPPIPGAIINHCRKMRIDFTPPRNRCSQDTHEARNLSKLLRFTSFG
ncbi:MAG: hypothetical protein AAYR33_00220 [Acetobacteraceae bacterium]